MVICPNCGEEYSLGRKIYHSCEGYSIEHGIIFNDDRKDRPWNCTCIDDTDKKILNFLQENNKISYRELADKLKMAASTIHNRVKKMIEEEIIKQFGAIVDPEKIGYKTTALIGLTVDPIKMSEIAEKIASYDETQLVAVSSGDHDIIAQIIAKDEKSLWNFINIKIKTINGIKPQIHVSSFLDIYKSTQSIKIT
ncbi:MAG: Lrp/AsnC family transcriptional regulator [Promethearchaeota archaeon]|nr:MAG: Lrp/AsnC family transcriptional regulator [Candidatus Lokiarchaeota archaeon]